MLQCPNFIISGLVLSRILFVCLFLLVALLPLTKNSEAAVWGCYVAGNWTCVPNPHAWGLGGACDQAERYSSYETCKNRAKRSQSSKQPAKKARPSKKPR
jgi:hypothetical protein